MAWVRLDDQFTDHPKIVRVGPMAGWLYVCGLSYAARYLTDGLIPEQQVRRLADLEEWSSLADRLVSSGLWERVDGGYLIHDYLDYQPSADDVRAEREANAKRQAEWRRRKAENRNDVSNAVTNGPVTPAPSYSRPTPVLSDSPLGESLKREPNGADTPTPTPAKPNSRSKPKTPVPKDFELTPKHYEVGAELGLSRAEIELETKKFLAHYGAHGTTMKDWQLAWNNWMLKIDDFRPKRRSGRDEPSPTLDSNKYKGDAYLRVPGS